MTIDIKKRYPTKKEGVFYRKNGSDDKVFYYGFKNKLGKRVEKKVGAYKDGTRESHAVAARAEAIRKNMVATMLPDAIKEKDIPTLNAVAEEHFARIKDAKDADGNEIKVVEYRKAQHYQQMIRYSNYIGFCKNLIALKIEQIERDKPNNYHQQLAKLKRKTDTNPLGRKKISEIKEKDLEEILDKLKEKEFSEQYIRLQINTLSAIFYTAIKKKYISSTPVRDFKKDFNIVEPDNASDRYLRDDEIEKLLDTVKDNAEAEMFIMLGLFTGARSNAILNIRKIDIQERLIKLHDDKRSMDYHIPIAKKLREHISKNCKKLAQTAYLVGGGAEPYSYDNLINNYLSEVYMKLFNNGLDYKKDRKLWVSSHTLRHTFASRLAIMGTSIYSIQKLMNHKKIEMTERYAKLSPDNGQEFLDRL